MPVDSPPVTQSPSAPRVAAAADPARLAKLALLISLAVGIALRLLQYAVTRSLWLDEALLASSVLSRPVSGLLQPLDYGQTAPTGFLLLVKGAVALFGS